jgi:diguanylate cyclase (GGDEF)-like protein
MLHFTDATTDLEGALTGRYDAGLVLVSYLVATLAAYAGLLMSDRMHVASRRRVYWLWLGAGGATMGIGVWAMHFIGMLAYVLPIPVGYDLPVTVFSVAPAIAACGLALHIMAGSGRSPSGYVIAGTTIGAGIGAMHFTGMAAMRMDAMMYYDQTLFLLSILIAAGLGVAALYAQCLRLGLPRLTDGRQLHPISAVLVGLAITGMHYTAMQATYVVPDATLRGTAAQGIGGFGLTVGVTLTTMAIIALAIVATLVDRRLERAARLLRVTRERMMQAIESLSDGFILFDDGGNLVLCNSVFRQMYPGLEDVLKPPTSYERVLRAWAKGNANEIEASEREAYVAQCLERFKAGVGGGQPPEEEDRLQDGRWVYIRQRPVSGGGMVGVWADVTPIKELQALYEGLAFTDTLTGLPNRKCFEDRLLHAAAHARRNRCNLAMLYVDLDTFKPINDRYGHEAGDAVLREVALRLRSAVRESDTVARLGGDEFAIILEPLGERESPERAAERVLEALTRPIVVGGISCKVGASIGIAVAPVDKFDALGFVRMADQAMYDAKNAGRNAYRVRTA